ncbi:MAG: O-antigen ligase family protein [Elusimicrobia bacterium]|nr:O-antigen ligase family protein [Elusimicrobiota bacterium]
MSRKKTAPKEPPPFSDGWLLTALWVAAFVALAVVPDQKILRYKLLAAEAGAAAVLAWVLGSWAARPGAAWVKTPLDVAVALYAAGGILFYTLSSEHGASSLELTRVLFSAAAFFAASQTIRRLPKPEVPVWSWAAMGAVAGVYALLQTRGGLGPLMVPQAERPIFTFGNPIFFSAFLASATCVAGALTVSGNKRGLWSLCAALAFAGLWTTQTRASVAGLIAAAGLAAILSLDGRKRLAAFATVAGAMALAVWYFRARQWTHGMIWRDTLSLWTAHPFLGCGLGRFHIEFPSYASPDLRALWPESKVIVNFAHNEYLQVLAETGVLGLALLAGVMGGWLGMLRDFVERKELEHRALIGGLLLAAGALFAQNAFSPDMRFGVSSFLVFWALGAAAALGWGESITLPEFPGRYAFALAGLFALGGWGRLAAQPILAERRLKAQPSFHVSGGSEFDQAVRALQGRLESNPQDVDAAENLAFLHAKAKQWPEAVRYFELTAALAPDRPGPLNNLGNIAYSLGDREKAILWWERSLELGPEQVDARLNLGKTLYEMGRLKASSKHLEQVLQREPGNEKAQILLKKMVE